MFTPKYPGEKPAYRFTLTSEIPFIEALTILCSLEDGAEKIPEGFTRTLL
jgi:hypothetical protein